MSKKESKKQSKQDKLLEQWRKDHKKKNRNG